MKVLLGHGGGSGCLTFTQTNMVKQAAPGIVLSFHFPKQSIYT